VNGMNKTNTSTIIVMATLVLVASGMMLIPVVDNQVHELIFKDSDGKVKNFVKNVLGKIFDRNGNGRPCSIC
jgi:hypothetical protein